MTLISQATMLKSTGINHTVMMKRNLYQEPNQVSQLIKTHRRNHNDKSLLQTAGRRYIDRRGGLYIHVCGSHG